MKIFRRILFNTLTAISLLLAIATAGLWVRSAFRWDAFTLERRESTWVLYGVETAAGTIRLSSIAMTGNISEHEKGIQYSSDSLTDPEWSDYSNSSDLLDRLIPDPWWPYYDSYFNMVICPSGSRRRFFYSSHSRGPL